MFSRSSMVLAFALSALAAFGTGCAASSGEEVASDVGAMTGATSATKATVRTLHKTVELPLVGASDQATACTMTASYLDVSGLGNAAVEDKINAALAVHQSACDIEMTEELTQDELMNYRGFLTVRTTHETTAGAHPEVSVSMQNFRLSDGAQLTAKDMFADDAAPKMKALVIKAINAMTTDDDTKRDMIASLDDYWTGDLESIEVGLMTGAIAVDMTNNYPHVILGLAPSVLIPWSDVAPLLKPGTPILPLTK